MKRSKAAELSLDAIRALRPLMVGLRRRDRAVWYQLVRAVTNVSMNIARAESPVAAERREHLLAAVASVSEARAVLHLAVDWGYCAARRAKDARTTLDRTLVTLCQLVRR